MSLVEQFFSDINKNYMYDMLDRILNKDHNIHIKEDKNNFTIFNDIMDTTFKEVETDDISDINKLLLDKMLLKMKDKYSNHSNRNELETSLEELIKEREDSILNVDSKSKEGEVNTNKSVTTNISDLFKGTGSIEGQGMEIKDKGTPTNILIQETNEEDEIRNSDSREMETLSINSSQRKSIQSSRYNYTIDLLKKGIDSKKIIGISKLIIPIEDNYLFSIPILLLTIKEFNLEIYLQQDEIINNGFNKLGIYKAIEKHNINVNDIDQITISIHDITGEEYHKKDILKIKIIEIKDNIMILTCSHINKSDYHVNDHIKIININSYNMDLVDILSVPMQINAIKDNIIFCKLNGKYNDNIFNDIDMKILNMSNQNLLIFNQYS